MVVDRLTKSTNFIPVKSTYSTEDYAKIFLDEIMCRRGIPLSIISDRGANSRLDFGGHSRRVGYKVKVECRFSSLNE